MIETDHPKTTRRSHAHQRVLIGGVGAQRLTLAEVVTVARERAEVALAPGALERVRAARAFVDRLTREDRTVYGVTTGFGHLSRVKIPPEQVEALQRNLIRSHASGVGEPFDIATARAVMLMLANSLARGHSGVREQTLHLLMAALNHDVTPVIPTRGSVGASGDLAPLAHLSLALIGEGEAWHAGERLPAAEALRRAGLNPITLGAKEGLALINGTHVMEACGALALADAWRLTRAAEVAVAMSIEALLGSYVPLDPRIHALRPQRGQPRAASRLRLLLDDSEINHSHADCGRVQDPYTLRCAPQVLGAARDALDFCEQAFSAELGAVTDNPLLFPDDGEALTGGNFHGQPLAQALDLLAISLAHVASFSERRSYNLTGPHDWDTGEGRIPLFLTPEPGLNSGYMIPQYVAAALVNEIKVLAHPASIDSIPTSAGMEDFVSMGATSALKLRQALDLAYRVIAIELLLAAQGLDFRAPLKPGRGVAEAHAAVRRVVPTLGDDRPPAPDIEALASALRDGLLDGLAPEESLAEATRRPRAAKASASGSKRPAATTADRAGRSRH
ncbi:MAG TPA: histidine ammonia-lyase [Ktedonobacterales bacterium]|jgi:histidine ammonia-lyase|nr:histidine ammonia-lyase [Ktedonobacterales bacterium]